MRDLNRNHTGGLKTVPVYNPTVLPLRDILVPPTPKYSLYRLLGPANILVMNSTQYECFLTQKSWGKSQTASQASIAEIAPWYNKRAGEAAAINDEMRNKHKNRVDTTSPLYLAYYILA